MVGFSYRALLRGGTLDSGFRHACQGLPVRSGTEALQNVNLVSVRADQNARLAAFDSEQNPRRSHLGRSPEKLFKPGRFLLESRSCNAGPDPRAARDLRSNPAGMHARYAHGAAREFMAQAFRKSTHRKLAR